MIHGYNSRFGICADCNPVRYDLKSEEEVVANPKGKYRIAEPLPDVDRPSSVVKCVETGRIAVFDPKEVPVWGIRPFRTYDGLHPSVMGSLRVIMPNVFVRLWHLITWKLRIT